MDLHKNFIEMIIVSLNEIRKFEKMRQPWSYPVFSRALENYLPIHTKRSTKDQLETIEILIAERANRPVWMPSKTLYYLTISI